MAALCAAVFCHAADHPSKEAVDRGQKLFVQSCGFCHGNDATGSRAPDLIRSASDRHSVDADLIRAVIKVESDFDSSARSNKGAMGLMQLMPETARLHNVVDLYNPSANIDGGVRHLKLLLGRYQGDLELSLAAYNAGIKAVEKHGGIPPFAETREYVRRVLSYYQSYRGDTLQASRPFQP